VAGLAVKLGDPYVNLARRILYPEAEAIMATQEF
jgi:hypothetical protein